MNKRLMSVAIILATMLSATAKNDDPVLMTINGKKVPLSEFEYLYNKNNSQQVQQQSIDEYVDMFITYKLKVADAEAAGIDKTPAFIKEFNGYRKDLATPYLRDNTVEDSLIAKAYSHMSEDVDVSHIMLPLGYNSHEDDSIANKLNEMRNQILNGSAKFEDIAVQYSIDGMAKQNKGHMGYISAGKYPYTFEDAAYDTKVGEISPVIKTPFGHHIVKVHGRRPAKGEVHARHILKLTQGKSPEQEAIAKAQSDSIYNLLKAGADFVQLARTESDCGSARQGGDLGWFGGGQMIPEFEEVAFNLKDGEMSAPFKSRFGYHIVYKIESKGLPEFEDAAKKIKAAMNNDERSSMADKVKLEALKAEHKTRLDKKNMAAIKEAIKSCGGYDSTFINKYADSDMVLGYAGELTVTVAEVLANMPVTASVNAENGYTLLNNTAEHLLDAKTLEYETICLADKHPDFRNLINEYRDGMLLFEISNQNVWDKASKDKEGLEKFFQANKYKYTWDGPKYKGYIIFTANDSVMSEVDKFLATKNIPNDSVAKVLRAQFKRDVKVDKVLAYKGENEIVDHIAFNGPAPSLKGKWLVFKAYNGKKISWPEEAADVRGPVTSDYQSMLEKNWVKSLKEKYPVKVNKKVLQKVKDK